MSFRLLQLPVDRWQEYKTLRLEAVQDSPLAFLDTYEEELQKPDQLWQQRLATMLFAESEGEIVGMLGYYQEPSEKTRHIRHLVSLYVQKAQRRQGIARALLAEVIGHSQSDPQLKKLEISVISSQQPAFQLYQKMGFQVIGKASRALRWQDQYYDEYFLEYLLS